MLRSSGKGQGKVLGMDGNSAVTLMLNEFWECVVTSRVYTGQCTEVKVNHIYRVQNSATSNNSTLATSFGSVLYIPV